MVLISIKTGAGRVDEAQTPQQQGPDHAVFSCLPPDVRVARRPKTNAGLDLDIEHYRDMSPALAERGIDPSGQEQGVQARIGNVGGSKPQREPVRISAWKLPLCADDMIA